MKSFVRKRLFSQFHCAIEYLPKKEEEVQITRWSANAHVQRGLLCAVVFFLSVSFHLFLRYIRKPLNVVASHIKMNMFLVASVAKMNHLFRRENWTNSQSYFCMWNWGRTTTTTKNQPTRLFNYLKLATKRDRKTCIQFYQMNREKCSLSQSVGNKCNEIKFAAWRKNSIAMPNANNSIGSNSIFTLLFRCMAGNCEIICAGCSWMA